MTRRRSDLRDDRESTSITIVNYSMSFDSLNIQIVVNLPFFAIVHVPVGHDFDPVAKWIVGRKVSDDKNAVVSKEAIACDVGDETCMAIAQIVEQAARDNYVKWLKN